MPGFDVTVSAVVRVQATDFQKAAELAQGIVKGTIRKPDNARIMDALVTRVDSA